MNEQLTDIELFGLHQAMSEIEKATSEVINLGEKADPQLINLARTYARAILAEDKYESFWSWANEIEDLSRIHCKGLPSLDEIADLNAIVYKLCEIPNTTRQ